MHHYKRIPIQATGYMLQPFNFYSGPATNELAKWNIQKLKYKLELAAMWQEKHVQAK